LRIRADSFPDSRCSSQLDDPERVAALPGTDVRRLDHGTCLCPSPMVTLPHKTLMLLPNVEDNTARTPTGTASAKHNTKPDATRPA
jgi:uncharacterized protein (DUF111 family)